MRFLKPDFYKIKNFLTQTLGLAYKRICEDEKYIYFSLKDLAKAKEYDWTKLDLKTKDTLIKGNLLFFDARFAKEDFDKIEHFLCQDLGLNPKNILKHINTKNKIEYYYFNLNDFKNLNKFTRSELDPNIKKVLEKGGIIFLDRKLRRFTSKYHAPIFEYYKTKTKELKRDRLIDYALKKNAMWKAHLQENLKKGIQEPKDVPFKINIISVDSDLNPKILSVQRVVQLQQPLKTAIQIPIYLEIRDLDSVKHEKQAKKEQLEIQGQDNILTQFKEHIGKTSNNDRIAADIVATKINAVQSSLEIKAEEIKSEIKAIH